MTLPKENKLNERKKNLICAFSEMYIIMYVKISQVTASTKRQWESILRSDPIESEGILILNYVSDCTEAFCRWRKAQGTCWAVNG